MTANEYIKIRFGRHMDQCTNEEIYIGLLEYVKDKAQNKEIKGGKKKLKKYKANVTGVVLDGVGYGQATIKKPAGGPWIVTVE